MAVSRKWWEIGPTLLLITNRKWHTSYQITWKSLTLNDWKSLTTSTVGYPSNSWALCYQYVLFCGCSQLSIAYQYRLSSRSNQRRYVIIMQLCHNVRLGYMKARGSGGIIRGAWGGTECNLSVRRWCINNRRTNRLRLCSRYQLETVEMYSLTARHKLCSLRIKFNQRFRRSN